MALQDINFDREKKRESYAVENNGPATRDESSCFFLKLSERLRELRIKQEELAQMQKQLQAEYTELMDKCLDSIEDIARNPVECELLFELLKNEATAAVLCYNLRLHPSIINSNLMDLAERGFVEYTIKNSQQYWKICETGVENK
ncbi:hypothetical protein DSECCO2_621970 [anaerobic digester metagenome]|jgi:ArsR family transcriptional regulator